MESNIVNGRYTIKSVIGEGKFGMVLKAHDIITEEPVAIKLATDELSLKHETKIMTYLFQNRFRKLPFIYWYGSQNSTPYLVMTYYDCSLEAFLHSDEGIAINMGGLFSQCICILENLHKLYVLHRDIKPENFMVKSGGVDIELVLIDYGLATFWMDGDGEHIANRPQSTITGTPKYVSYNNHMGDTISRRDDLISLGYMIMYFIYGYLPWQGSPSYIEKKDIDNLLDFLENETPIDENTPSSKMRYYMEYCYSLEYDETPDYSILCELFRTG